MRRWVEYGNFGNRSKIVQTIKTESQDSADQVILLWVYELINSKEAHALALVSCNIISAS